jgi:hypothetical protein
MIVFLMFPVPNTCPASHILLHLISLILRVRVTYITGFGFDDRIYWTFIQLVTAFHKSLSSTGHSGNLTSNLTELNCQSSQSHIATDGQSVSLGIEPHLGLVTRYLLFLDSYGLVSCGAPSLTRGQVCLLCMLLVLASAVFLGSESLGTRDHMLLSHI